MREPAQSEVWSATRSRQHPDDCHHAVVLMFSNMAMVGEVAYNGSAKIHPKFNAGERMFPVTIPKRDLDGIQKLTIDASIWPAAVLFKVVLRQHAEVNLVNVKFVVLQGVVLDSPVLHRPLPRDDCRRPIWIEQNRRRPLDGNKELRGRIVFGKK